MLTYKTYKNDEKEGELRLKTLIGIPCRGKVHTAFSASLLGMRRVGETHYDFKQSTMIFDGRNEIAVDAITSGADRVMMIDTDMTFKPDMMERMSARLDEGCEMVCGIFFRRVTPTAPVIFTKLQPPILADDGKTKIRQVVEYRKYPKDSLFPVEGCGFGAVMMTTDLIKDVWDHYGAAFAPTDWCGEDMAFCYRARQLGHLIWCDSSIKVGHIGDYEYNERTYLQQLKMAMEEKK